MSKLQRQEDEVFEVAYLNETRIDCLTCQIHHGQFYRGVRLVCAIHPHGYSGNSCQDYEAKRKATWS